MESVDTLKGASLGERLMAGRSEKQQDAGAFVGRIECGGGHILARYRAMTYREDRQVGQRHKAISDEVEREIRLAADTLASACTGCEIHIGDEVFEKGPLGLALANELGLDGAENDIQAVLALFPSERAMIEQFVELEAWVKAVNAGVDDDIEGKSVAATG